MIKASQLFREICMLYYEENRQIVNRQQRKLYAMYAIGNTISIVKKYQININLKVESVYKIPKALEIDLFSFFVFEMNL